MDAVFLVLRVAVSLGVVLAVIWWAHRRLTAGRARTRKTELVTVVARQAVAPKASVVVVDVDGRRLTLGVTEHGVSVLHDREVPGVAPLQAVGRVASASERIETRRAGLDTADTFGAILATTEADADAAQPPIQFPTRSAARAASASLATHGMRRGSMRSAETWKRSLAGVREGLGI